VRVRPALAALVVAPLLVLGAAPAGASGRPTGNAAAMALYAKAVRVMNARGAITEVARGQYYWGYSGGSAWRLDVGSATAPYPYEHHVNERVTLAVSGGKTTWELNQFVCPTAGGCASQGTLSIYGTPSAVYWGTSSGAAGLPTCWTQASGQTEWMVRGYSPGWHPFSVTTGAGYTAQHYVSVKRQGSRDVFTSTFSTSNHVTHVTEVDTMVASTDTFVGTTYRVAASPGHPAYRYSYAYSYPATAPAPPTLTMCNAGG
jgi:hypothetical protein